MGTCLDCERIFTAEEFETELMHRVCWIYTVGSDPPKAVVEIDHVEIARFEGKNVEDNARNFAGYLREQYICQRAVLPYKVV